MVDAERSSFVATVKVEVANEIGNEDGQSDDTGADAVEDETRVHEWVVVSDDKDVLVVGPSGLRGTGTGQTTTCCLEDAAQTGRTGQHEDDNAEGNVHWQETSSVAGSASFAAQQHQEGDEAKEELQNETLAMIKHLF